MMWAKNSTGRPLALAADFDHQAEGILYHILLGGCLRVGVAIVRAKFVALAENLSNRSGGKISRYRTSRCEIYGQNDCKEQSASE